MIRAALKDLISPDADIFKYQPIEADDFRIFIECTIGTESAEGGDLFGLTICSPKWIAREALSEDLWLKHCLVLPRYNLEAIRNAIGRIIESSDGPDWISVARKIAEHMDWEFTNYKER